ncbi:MAG: sigma-70 family RNA polymerase sigma factor [Polyangiaceae bacterium]|nr:sigma-70 family RNA polymerase sigma factor [Polyangiaceae bacterium]
MNEFIQPKLCQLDLIQAYRKALLAYALTILRDRALAEDIVQEVALILTDRIGAGLELDAFWAYARETARRKCLEIARERKRWALSERALDVVDAAFDSEVSNRDSQETALAQCIDKLPVKWSQIVDLRYRRLVPVNEIARELKATPSTISVTLNRIRARLAECVSTQLEGLNR